MSDSVFKDNTTGNNEDNDDGRNSFYRIDDEATTAQYMKDTFKEKIVLPTHDDTTFNPFVIRHAMTQDMDVTTFLMWMQAFAPLISGMIVGNGVLKAIGLGFIGKYIFLCLLDALFGLMDIYVLHKHDYDVKNLVVWSVWLPPVYMKRRSNLLGEKNFQHIVWTVSLLILIIL